MKADKKYIGLTAEQYKAVIAIVDERLKEIRVTRKDFDDLKAVVGELVKSHEELVKAQTRTEARVEELAKAQARTEKAQMRTEARVEELAKAQARTEARVEELAKAQARTERALRNLTVQVGRLTDTIGYGLEDIARVVLPGYLESHYNVRVEELERKFIEVNGRIREINLYGEGVRNGKKVIVVGETRSRIYEKDVKSFIKNIGRLVDQFDAEVLKVMFGYFIHPLATKLAREEDIILVASYQR